MTLPSSAPIRPRWRRWVARLAWTAVWLITIFVLAVSLENWLGSRAWQRALAAARATGEPTEFSQVVPPPIPDDRNFAAIPLFQPLFDYRLTPPSREQPFGTPQLRDPTAQQKLTEPALVNPPRQGDWRKCQFVDLENWLEPLQVKDRSGEPAAAVLQTLASRYGVELDAVRVGAARPEARFPIRYEDGFVAALPQIGLLGHLNKIVRLRALAELSLGEVPKAQQDLLLGWRLAEAVRTEPLLISQLVRLGQYEALMQPLWEGLARRQWNEEQLASFAAALEKPDFLQAWPNAIRGEQIIFVIRGLDAIKQNPGLLASLVGPSESTPFVLRILMHIAPSGWIDFNKIYLRASGSRMIRSSDPANHRFFPEAARAAAAQTKEDLRDRRWDPRKMLAAEIVPSLQSAAVRFATSQATIDLARVAVALERYRLAHGEWPESLDLLVPAYLPQKPSDVLNGKPLTYHRIDEARFSLYSVGWNGSDEGGKPTWLEPVHTKLDWSRGDLIWPPYPAP